MTHDEAVRTAGEAAAALRAAAGELIEKAERIEEAIAGMEAAAAEAPPLAPATGEDEANARLVALDLSTSGISREEAERLLAGQFPSVDSTPLLDRFFPS